VPQAITRSRCQSSPSFVCRSSLELFSLFLEVSESSPSGVVGARTTRSDQREPVTDSLPPIEILVVDDDADARDLLTLLVESRGARTRTVSSAQEAFEIIRHNRPDLLLADIRMPDEDGLSLIRRVRAWERELRDERLPAIAVTAYASGRDREEAIAAGYDSHIAKPIDPEELTRAIVDVATPENA